MLDLRVAEGKGDGSDKTRSWVGRGEVVDESGCGGGLRSRDGLRGAGEVEFWLRGSSRGWEEGHLAIGWVAVLLDGGSVNTAAAGGTTKVRRRVGSCCGVVGEARRGAEQERGLLLLLTIFRRRRWSRKTGKGGHVSEGHVVQVLGVGVAPVVNDGTVRR
jgi:hypothetical protein